MEIKKCTKCKECKELKYYWKSKESKDGYNNICADCKNKYERSIKDKREIARLKYYSKEKNKVKQRLNSKNWYENNKVQHQLNHINRRKNNPVAALSKLFRDRLYKCFKHEGKKNKPTLDILGCDWITLKEWVESHFKNGMSWENKGKGVDKWNLDHGIPLSWAECENDIYTLNHYTNLKPEWSLDNLSKHDYYGEIWNGKNWIIIEKEYYLNNKIV